MRKYTKIFLLSTIFLLLMIVDLNFKHSVADAAETSINHRSSDIFFQGKPSLSRFTSRDGLPVNSVMTIERDRRGYIWFGTQDGAAVFNGHNFSVINMPNRAASNYIFDILTASDGSIWFGTNGGGVHKFKDDEWTTFNTNSGLKSNEIRALLETKNAVGTQTIWIGRRDGLSKFENGAFTNFDEKDGLPDKRVRSLLETTGKNGKKTLWIGTYGGIGVWEDGEKKIVNEKDGLPGKTIFALLETKNESDESVVWAGTEKGVAKFENGNWETFGDVSEILTKPVRALGKTEKADGTKTVWIGFDGAGLAYFEKDKWYFLDDKDGLPNNEINAFAETGSLDGSVWISNLGAGVSRFERSNWRSFEDKEILPNKIVFDIEETIAANGGKSYWFATYGGGLVQFAGGEWKTFKEKGGLGNEYIQTLFSTKNEGGETVLYIGTEKGLVKYENEKFEEIKISDETPLLEVWNIRESKNEKGKQELLISASFGLIRKSEDSQIIYNKSNGLPDRRVRDALETVDENGEKTLWVATYSGGLAKFADGKWTVFDDKNGFPTKKVYTLAEIKTENSRQLWVGTSGGGIAVFDLQNSSETFQIISKKNSGLLPTDTVYKIFQDDKNRIYAATTKGVSRINTQPNGDFSTYTAYFFTTEDGLPEDECNAGAGFIDSEGRVWIGTVGGAGLLDVSREFNDTRAEPLFLENVLINGEKRPLQPNSVLPYNENNLVFEYVMPTNFRENSTIYRTRLVGLEDKPTDWTKEPRREFTFIPSGEYTFKIWGKDAGGNISGALEIPFEVRPAWWQTWWAFALFMLATAGIVALIAYGIYRNRYLRMLEIERVRTRIATDLHDDVGSSLSKISILSEVLVHGTNGSLQNKEKESLMSIADTSRNIVGSMSDMVWSINPNRDNLRDTIQRMREFAAEILSARDIEFSFDVPDNEREIKLDVDMRRQLYLIFKESINNAVKYSNCTKVEIEIKQKRDIIALRVSDNGDGFDTEQINYGNGLKNMKNRTAEIGGKIEIKSEIGKGTSVNLQIPRRTLGFSLAKTT